MQRLATIEQDGWELESAEARHAEHPDTFWIPPRPRREELQPGEGAKLLFRIASPRNTGVERLWVIVRRRVNSFYVGVLDSAPVANDEGWLARGSTIVFAPEHVADISTPDRDYVIRHYGEAFFSDAHRDSDRDEP